MKARIVCVIWLLSEIVSASPRFVNSNTQIQATYTIQSKQLCLTAQNTLAYLNKGNQYDPQVIHDGKALRIPLERVKKTLLFICNNQSKLNNPTFIKEHFELIRWYPDSNKAKQLSKGKPLLLNLPIDKVLMTKYFVHLAKASAKPSSVRPYALYALPADEAKLSLEEANAKPYLTRFKYGKHAILKGALNKLSVNTLAYLTRDDLETSLLQGTVVADFGSPIGKKIFNVHRNNNIPYERSIGPYAQERYWYFKEVDGIKGYGKDADHKITVYPEVTFAGDINELGLGRVLLIQYKNKSGESQAKIGILADTGGAFDNNLYQIDYLAGSFSGKEGLYRATKALPDYVEAYFMLLKEK